MTFDEIKAALIDGAVVRIIGIDYADSYHIDTSRDGHTLRGYSNYRDYPVHDILSDIEIILSRTGVSVFRGYYLDRTRITIINDIGEEV